MSMTDHRVPAADLAANAALLEIAENLGLSALLDRGTPVGLDEVARTADVPEAGARLFLDALVAAGLLMRGDADGQYVPAADLGERRYEAGYLSWSLNANRPYLDHPALFLRDRATAAERYQRDGRRVAVSSRWIGSRGFYPGVLAEIIARKPQRIVDLGAGAAGLLIQLLTALPGSTGLALDLSPGACEEAEQAARRAEVGDRLEVVNSSVESLIDDPSPVRGADVVHAGFVMHDLVARPETLHGVLRVIRQSLAAGGCLVVTDAVPYVENERERAFSALFSYLHASSMDVRLPTEQLWRDAFNQAGFGDVTSEPLGMPGSRVLVAAV